MKTNTKHTDLTKLDHLSMAEIIGRDPSPVLPLQPPVFEDDIIVSPRINRLSYAIIRMSTEQYANHSYRRV